MARRYLVAALALMGSAAAAEQATFVFEWEGASGYSIKGTMTIPEVLTEARVVTEEDVSCFVIEGFLEDRKIGRWSLADRDSDTTWVLTFLPRQNAFAVSGPATSMPQGWNMNGRGDDCGEGGFGFNLGNIGQDVCLDDELHTASRVDPAKPLPALRDDSAPVPADACPGILPLS